MRRLHLLPLLAALAACFSFSAWLSAADEERIQRVESGLAPAVRIEGRPSEGWRIADRQRALHTPGVSAAVVENHQLRWARAWGDGATSKTRFQAASIR